ncbi:hypothetical protein PAWBP_3700 [Paulownia witches'-broom phytoplasma]|nr:hypothetical protein PAWBP_3700 [Paulownia witches'-broom phytoplasma]
MEKVWQEAESHDKTIIFIDEIEGLENRNDSNISSGGVNVINTLLDKLDGFNSSNKKIVLMGATELFRFFRHFFISKLLFKI